MPRTSLAYGLPSASVVGDIVRFGSLINRITIGHRWRSVRGLPPDSSLGTWGTRSSSAPTEDTRVSADETGVRLREMR